MDQKLLAALQKLEPQIRALSANAQNINISISVDPNGTNYSVNISDTTGAAESYSKRFPRSAATA